MTDLATKPEPAGDDAPTTVLSSGAPVEWAPAEPEKKKRRLGLWLGIPGGLIAVGAAVCSAILIAPGVVAAGADVGWRTAGSATETIADSLASAEITITVPSGDITVTGADLGVSVDAQVVAEQAFGDHPLWNVGAWNPGSIPIEVTVDPETARAALAEAAPELFTAPVNAEVRYDDGAGAYTVVEAQAGSGVDIDALAASISTALSETTGDVTVDTQTSEVAPAVTTADAQAEVESLNALIADAGFYIDGTEVLDVEPAQVASWITVTTGDDGFQVAVDEAAVQEVVDGLPEKVNRDVVDEEVVTNSSGDHLRVVQEGQDGWGLASTDGVAAAFSEQLAAGDGAFEVPVEAVPYETQELFRRIEVDKSAGTTTLYENEQVVDTYSIALGKAGHDTQEGHFTVYGQLTIQDMGSCDAAGNYVPGGSFDYCTADVPWVTYFNGDQGFHGTYWHSNFGAGAMMSHGCVNMTISAAERVYYFAQTGTEVWVHA